MARFSPDGRRIAARRDSAPDRKGDVLGIHDADTGRVIREFKGKSTIGERFTFNGNGSRVMMLSESRNVTVWEIDTDRTWQLGEPGKSGWIGAGFSPDGTRIFLERTSDDSTRQKGIAILDGETHQPLIDLECPPIQYYFWFRSFSADGRRFLAYYTSRDNTIGVCRIWDTTTGRLLREFKFGTERLYAIELSPDGSRIIKIDWDNRLLILDSDTGEELLVRTIPWLLAAAFDRTGQKLIVAGSNEVRILDGTPLPEPKK